MSPAVSQRKPRSRRPSRRPQPRGASLLGWWPLAVALLLTPFAVRGAAILALSGPAALRLLFPFLTLIQTHGVAGLAAEQRANLAGVAMWAQFPVYGLLLSLIARRTGLFAGLMVVFVLHIAAVAAATLLLR